MSLLRSQLGAALRGRRAAQRRTLRDVAGTAGVSLGYLSEVERGVKEASSELLGSICAALGVRLPDLLVEVADALYRVEATAAGEPVLVGALVAVTAPTPAGDVPATAAA